MKKTLLCTLLFCIAGATWAQKDAEAKKVLEKASAAFSKAGGVEIGFSVKGAQAMNGTVKVKGNQFAMVSSASSTWYDGKTQWTYLKNTEEVNISTPSPDQVQRLNPQAWINGYKKKFNYKYNGISGSNYKITLTPETLNQSLKSVVLFLNTRDYSPAQIEITQANGQTSTIVVTRYRTGQKYTDNSFRFDPKKYPHAEVIDLR